MFKSVPGWRPSVLVFAGHDPSGGAGIIADSAAIVAQGAHALTVITALTVQNHQRVYGIQACDPDFILQQARVLLERCQPNVIKLGILGNAEVAAALLEFLRELKRNSPSLQIVMDPVLASGKGDALSSSDPVQCVKTLWPIVDWLLPNVPELMRLNPDAINPDMALIQLRQHYSQHLVLKGGHVFDHDQATANEQVIVNRYWSPTTPSEHDGLGEHKSWQWTRLPDEFHGSGCTLASALAGQLARGVSPHDALYAAQSYTQQALSLAYSIQTEMTHETAEHVQQIPLRLNSFN